MEKLKKEDVYINLQGKSEDELTELYWLLKNNNEEILNDGLDSFIRCYLNIESKDDKFHFYSEVWSCACLNIANSKQEVTIQQLKEILQPMETQEEQLIKEAIKRGFLTGGNKFYSCFDDRNKNRLIKPYDDDSELNLYLDDDGYLRYDDGLNNEYDTSLCSNPAVYKEGVWAEIINNNLTLIEQLEKAKAEVKRIEQEIEESKIKIGDWVISELNNCVFKYQYGRLEDDLTKITDQELINKLNNLIK